MHNPNNKECEQNKCGHFQTCNNYGCEGEHECTCPSISETFEGDNSSLKKTFEEAARHDPENKACAQAGYGDNYHGLGKIDCTCPAQKEEWVEEFKEQFDPKHPKGPIWHDYDDYLLCIDFIASQISLAEARGREEANKCDECGGTDVVCAKGVMDSIRLARTETITAFEEWAGKYMTETTKYYGTDKHGIDPDDLLSFASSLKSNAPKV